MPGSFAETIQTKRIVVCVGSGGVGKTTTAACFAIEAARQGKRALVLTIDPAKRLADSLGLHDLGHDVQIVPSERLAALGSHRPGGSLSAMMLDQRRAFDEMVETYSKDPEAVKRIFENPMYQQIAGTLTGSQEYAALAKLQAFADSDEYDFIVVDTPPTAHALDFLDAPKKLSDAIDSPAVEMFRKVQGEGGAGVIGKTGNYVVKMLAKFVGSQFLDDIAFFFGEFNDILGGFKQRADEVLALLHRSEVGFVIVTSPEAMAISEALFFHDRLTNTSLGFEGFAVNKVHAEFPTQISEAKLAEKLALVPAVGALSLQPTSLRIAAKEILEAHGELQTLAHSDQDAIARLPAARIAQVPFFEQDVHHIESLVRLRQYLFGAL